MEDWISESLSRLLDFQVPDDLIQYIISIQNENDLNEYLKTLLDFENSKHKNFFLELVKRKFPQRGSSLPKQQKKKISKNKQQQEVVTQPEVVQALPEPESKGKKKAKYVNLYSQEGKNAQVVLLKGRHHCDCQASKHELINNCLQCGRVVCKQEGSGPCLFCGNLVCTPEEQRELNSKTKASAKLKESLLERSRPKGWEAAVSHRNRLLEFDRTSERRTRVTDDDSDYFSANSVWLSVAEKDKLDKYQQSLHEKKHASRLNKKMTFDFAGRQIVEDKTIDHDVDEEKIRNITSTNSGRGPQHDMFVGMPSDRDVAPGINAPLLQFDPAVEGEGYAAVTRSYGGSSMSRIQDAELQEMSDTGRCLSMHQPWASLLVEGIKIHDEETWRGALSVRLAMVAQPPAFDGRSLPFTGESGVLSLSEWHEGRTWYTSHRGRLWIASTVKPPDQDVIRALENQYRVLYPDKQFQFPSFYPTGCLLGCVNVDDCLPQEEYEKRYPDGESDSPYVFICSNPVSLRLRFPIKGQHKIYQLDKIIHQAAMKCIQKTAKMQAEQANAG